MAWDVFKIANISEGTALSYEVECELNSIDSTPWLIVPAGVRSLTATVTTTEGATAIVQTTTDIINNIHDEDFEVSYTDWPRGAVSGVVCEVTNNRVNAIRCIQKTNGKVRFTVVC